MKETYDMLTEEEFIRVFYKTLNETYFIDNFFVGVVNDVPFKPKKNLMKHEFTK
tara:strand:- start:63 stop:224 length:162 start_codon:yes stop_codon:yes gene_type:complete